MDTDIQADAIEEEIFDNHHIDHDHNMRMRKNLVVAFNPAFFESQRQK